MPKPPLLQLVLSLFPLVVIFCGFIGLVVLARPGRAWPGAERQGRSAQEGRAPARSAGLKT